MKRIIDDIENDECTKTEVEKLLDYFEIVMASIAGTKAYKGCYNLADFDINKQCGLRNFSLVMERLNLEGQTFVGQFWFGTFTSGEKKLKVSGHLEEC
ncbi:hypothetical protein [Tolypothrix sp. VBCCA 56010]|uniref:hypothetical protein n=1 Tax=Tolypothrix sp. VBCCA 56010 TaxID=3137731 RepID=UPI003D7E12A1